MIKLDKILNYVIKENPFYQTRTIEKKDYSISDFLVLKRIDLQNNNKGMFSNTYESKYYNQQLLRQSSSGSSCIPISVFWDYKDWYISNLSLWRKRKSWYNIFPSDKKVIFTMNSYNMLEKNNNLIYMIEKNILSINISNLETEEQFLRLIEIINEFNPIWFYIQPLFLEKLLYMYVKYNLKVPTNLKYIESVGEILSKKLQNRASNFFGVPVVNMYGSEEMNCIAYECPHHNMHILTDNVFVEVYNGTFQTKGIGEAIITNLNNYAMPLIRYEQGDIIEILETKCMCGEDTPIISSILGRKHEIIKVEDIEINPYFLVEIMGEIINTYNDIIKNYLYTFNTKEKTLYCEIGIDRKYQNWSNAISKTLNELFNRKNYCKNINFKIIFITDNFDIKTKRKVVKIV